MGEKEFSDKQISVSEFNEASFQIYRLHGLWMECNQLSRSGDLVRYKWTLDRVWVELSSDAMSLDGYTDSVEWQKEDNKKSKYLTNLNQINQEIAKAKNNNNKYMALQKKEIFLRGLQEAVGKGGKKSRQFDQIM